MKLLIAGLYDADNLERLKNVNIYSSPTMFSILYLYFMFTRETEVRLDGWCEGRLRQQRNDGGGCAKDRKVWRALVHM